jgi:hypothetical protein
MKRLDLIINAIEDALKDFHTDSYDNDFHGCCGADKDVGHMADCKLAQARIAARELRDMLPVAITSSNYLFDDARAAIAKAEVIK